MRLTTLDRWTGNDFWKGEGWQRPVDRSKECESESGWSFPLWSLGTAMSFFGLRRWDRLRASEGGVLLFMLALLLLVHGVAQQPTEDSKPAPKTVAEARAALQAAEAAHPGNTLEVA